MTRTASGVMTHDVRYHSAVTVGPVGLIGPMPLAVAPTDKVEDSNLNLNHFQNQTYMPPTASGRPVGWPVCVTAYVRPGDYHHSIMIRALSVLFASGAKLACVRIGRRPRNPHFPSPPPH